MKTFIYICAVLFIIAITAAQKTNSQSSINEHSIKFNSQNNQSAMLVGEDGLIMNTVDGGHTWNQSQSGITNVFYGNAIADANTSFAAGENGIIMQTTDAGATWNLLKTGVFDNLKDIEILNGKTIIACGENGCIITSNDLGATWNTNKSVTTYNLNDVLVAAGVVYISGEHSTLLKSTDNGATWSVLDLGLGIFNLRSIGGADADNITVIGDSQSIFHTNNGGLTWQGIDGIQAGTLNSVVFFNSNEGVIVGDHSLVLKTYDGGANWKQVAVQTVLMAPLSQDFNSVAFSSINSGISVGTHGANIYSSDGGDSWTFTPAGSNKSTAKALNIVKDISKINLSQNYPNPFNPSTVISYQLPFGADVSIKVYDMLGKEVANLVSGFKSAGNYSTRFDGSNLSSGIYFYVLKASNGADNISKTMRMILTK